MQFLRLESFLSSYFFFRGCHPSFLSLLLLYWGIFLLFAICNLQKNRKKQNSSLKFKRECEMKEEIEVKRMIIRRTQLRKMLLFFCEKQSKKRQSTINTINKTSKRASTHKTQHTTYSRTWDNLST
jgi:hypothetical protein